MNRFWAIAIGACVLLIDQWSKSLVARTFLVSESRPIVPNFFQLTYVQNTGGAFGILQGSAARLVVTGVLVAAGILFWLARGPKRLPAIAIFALGLPLGGTVGNLIDRLHQGYVVDFFDVYTGPHHWPVFNVADSSICVGVGLLALWLWRRPEEAGAAPPAGSGKPVAPALVPSGAVGKSNPLPSDGE